MKEYVEALGILHRKNQQDNRPQVLIIAEEDLTLLREVIIEVVEKNLGDIMSRKTNWTASLTTKLNQLAEAVT